MNRHAFRSSAALWSLLPGRPGGDPRCLRTTTGHPDRVILVAVNKKSRWTLFILWALVLARFSCSPCTFPICPPSLFGWSMACHAFNVSRAPSSWRNPMLDHLFHWVRLRESSRTNADLSSFSSSGDKTLLRHVNRDMHNMITANHVETPLLYGACPTCLPPNRVFVSRPTSQLGVVRLRSKPNVAYRHPARSFLPLVFFSSSHLLLFSFGLLSLHDIPQGATSRESPSSKEKLSSTQLRA